MRALDRFFLTPLILQFAFWYMFGEGETTEAVLVTGLLAVFASALLAGAALAPPAAFIAAVWVPVLLTVFDLYWAMGSHAPYAFARQILDIGPFLMNDGRDVFCILCSLTAAAGVAVPNFIPPARKAFNRFSWSDLGTDD
ncbi:hypothetical protein EPO15_11050 [bacterium]|nr:MAG: hypothetical protein EPO15_11050 [bacterium]